MFNYLKTFRLVYETRSFSLTAAQLFVTQPTISHQIKQLEAQLGVQLFQRSGNHDVEPTAAAQILYADSTQLLATWQATTRKLEATTQQKSLMVVLGASQTIALTLLPDLVPQLHAQFPQAALRIKMMNSQQVLQQLQAHQLQIGLIEKPVVANGIERVAVMHDQLVRIGEDTGIWLTRERGSGTYQYTHQYLQEAGIVPQQLIEIDNVNLILSLVQRGMGQTVVSQRLVPAGVTAHPLSAHFDRQFYLLSNQADVVLDGQLRAVYQALQSMLTTD